MLEFPKEPFEVVNVRKKTGEKYKLPNYTVRLEHIEQYEYNRSGRSKFSKEHECEVRCQEDLVF
jgi:hypothetical protein